MFVVFGGDGWNNQPFDLGQLRANQSQGSNPRGFAIDGSPNSQAGIALNGGGDINGDGFADFIIGAPGENNLQYNQQIVFIENGELSDDDKYSYILYFDGNQTIQMGEVIGKPIKFGPIRWSPIGITVADRPRQLLANPMVIFGTIPVVIKTGNPGANFPQK
ncbi:hypothetical protein NON20_20085 [Synechocystis sp. B12]|nr:hypothetical protein NON20_20085 [Synechocystis sp. B12]